MMIKTALLVCLAKFVIGTIDAAFSWQTLSRPICAAPIAGLFLGQFRAGIILGGTLEAVFMGISAIGGASAADPLTSSLICVALATQYADIEEGIVAGTTLAMPIGVIMNQFNGLFTPLFAATAPYFEELAASGDIKKFRFQVLFFSFIIQQIVGQITLFVSIAFGTTGLTSTYEKLPAFVRAGLGASSGMMIGVGYAILLSMLWSGEVGCFFFVGFVLAKFVGLGSLQVAILGAAIAITMFFTDKKIIDLKNSMAANTEEDFF